jgi:hypothetical protein
MNSCLYLDRSRDYKIYVADTATLNNLKCAYAAFPNLEEKYSFGTHMSEKVAFGA